MRRPFPACIAATAGLWTNQTVKVNAGIGAAAHDGPNKKGNAKMVSSTAELAVGDGLKDTTTTSPDDIQHLVKRARIAQAGYESFSQEQVDAIVRDFGKHVYDNARELARMAFAETGLGVYEDKVLKALGKSRVIWNNLKGKKSRGIIAEDSDSNLVLVAKPMGVVGAVCPVTNPVVTPMCNAMFALKAGNAVIFAPHPKAEESTWALTISYREILRAHGAPQDLVQMVRNGSVETTQALMRSVDVVVATGGGAMVKSAYSSGKPSFGVGAGMTNGAGGAWTGAGAACWPKSHMGQASTTRMAKRMVLSFNKPASSLTYVVQRQLFLLCGWDCWRFFV